MVLEKARGEENSKNFKGESLLKEGQFIPSHGPMAKLSPCLSFVFVSRTYVSQSQFQYLECQWGAG